MVTPPSNQSAVEAAGQSFNLGSFSDGGSGSWTASVAWGDGTSMMLPAPSGPGSLGSSSHMYAEEGTYTVTVTVTDTGDQQSGTGMFQVTVSDPAVSASPSVGFNAMEGSAVSNQQLATFVDPAGAEALASYSASINWGDGTAATTGGISFSGSAFTITGSHTYAEEGSYTVTVTINHETSTTQTVTSTATVSDPAVAANGIGVNAVLSTSFTSAVATFTDPGSLEVLGDYSATINWGDSTPATTGTLALTNGIVTVSGSHAYTSTGSFTVTTTIHHDTATPTTVTSTAMVGNAPPPVVTAAGNQTATEAGSKSFTIGSFQDAGAGPDSGSINWGDGTTATSLGTVTPGTLSNQTHTYAEEGSYTVTITITDAATSQSGTGMFVVSVSDPSVTATGGVSVTAQEGAPSTSQAVATFTDPGIAEANDGTHYSASINWGNNTAATAGSISFSGTTFTVSGSHAYAEEGSYTLTVTINHENSAAQTVTSTATVSNANVAASGGLSFNGTEGTGLGTQTVATFTDPGGAEPIADYSATINWGDGTTATAGTITVTGTTFSITGSHSYGEEGTYTLSVTVNHETSTSQTITDTATISDVAVAATGVPVNAGVNSSSTVSVATFTDPGGTEPADGTHYSASITWGDNTPASVGTITLTNGVYTVMGTHTYTTIASFTITTTINHEGATPQTVMSTASVAMGIPPSVTAPGSQTSAEGMAQSFSLGSFTDPDGGPWTVDVAWGDGSAHTTVPGNTPGSLGSQPHTYAEEGSYTVTVTVKDTFDGQTGSGMFSVSVSNPSVVATGGLTFNASENTASATQPVATFTDPGGAEGLADYSATINWGDNTPPTTGTITQNGTTFTVSGSHTYTEEGSAPITVTINHEGITPATATSTAAVADVSVIATGGFSFSGTEGVLATTQTVATFTDPAGAEPNDGTHYTATINWGDGSTPSTGTISFAGGTFTVSGNHTYAEEGSATLTVTINHEGSTAQTATTTATISNPNIVASGGFSVSGSEGAGSSMQTVATFTDPGGAEGVADYNATIAWGDGTTPTAGTITVAGTTFSVLGSHTYGEEGSYPVTVAISHEASTAPMAISMATVSDPAVVGTPVNILFNPSVAFNGAVATFTDPGGAEANDGTHYSASIAWGDNTPTTAGTITFGNGKFTVSGTHTYGSGSTFPTTILLFHEGATPAMVNGTATIASTGQPVPPQMTKPISFWASIVGQELIKRFGLTSGGQTLGQWLATTLPNPYGGSNGAPNLTNLTNAQLGTFYLGLFNKQNTLKLDAEVMATALEVFTTTMSLGGTLGQQYGFLVNNFGLGAYTWNIGFNGPAFGVPNSTVETVFQILTATNSFAQGGEPWGSNTTLRNEGYSVFSGINGG